MRSDKMLETRVGYLKECCGAAELTVRLQRFNSEPTVVDIRACTFCGEVYKKRVYLSWLLRISQQELHRFAGQYLS